MSAPVKEPSAIETYRRWPHVMRIVERYVGDRALAYRYVSRATRGEPIYTKIIREAFARRHDYKRQENFKNG